MFFFFFQAEDGIRDGRVTGVQTCALPISSWSPKDHQNFPAEFREVVRTLLMIAARDRSGKPRYAQSFLCSLPREVRSEERRVGKECRSRWSPYQYKKKESRSQREREVRCK